MKNEILNQLVLEYALDTDNPIKNYNLAIEYKRIGQTASAVSYFLRCAEKTNDLNLSYECLIHIGLCFDSQGDRLGSAYGSFKQAMTLLPKRPEAYFYISRLKNWYGLPEDAYTFSSIALDVCDFENIDSLKNLKLYSGKYCLLFEKAISSWKWGKVEECKSMLLDLCENHWGSLSDYQKRITEEYLKKYYNISAQTVINKKIFNVDSYEKTDIVLQGPIDEITGLVVDEYLNLPFVNKIIVSTWKDCEFEYDHPKVSVVKSEYPLVPGTCNKNLQIVSTLAGLRECSSKYSIKMRADQKYSYDSMILLYDHFLKRGGLDGQKMFIAGIYPHLLYHPRDHVFWSTTSNLLKMFDIPLEYNSLMDKIHLGKYELANYYEHFTRPETYLGAHYLSKFDDRIKMSLIYPEKNLYDNSENWQKNYELSLELMPKHFEVFPAEGIQIEWPKRLKNRIPGEPEYTFFDPKIHMKGEKHFEDSPWNINS